MTTEQLTQYDLLMDENDWDIYYWVTQTEKSTTTQAKEDVVVRDVPPKGEWVQTAGNYKPAYRPVPQRWKDTEILDMLRNHVRERSVHGGKGKGMAFMPALRG